jgi:hypothetical protein
VAAAEVVRQAAGIAPSPQGDAGTILDKIQQYREAGVDRIVIEPVTTDLDAFLGQMERFALEVTPHIMQASALQGA